MSLRLELPPSWRGRIYPSLLHRPGRSADFTRNQLLYYWMGGLIKVFHQFFPFCVGLLSPRDKKVIFVKVPGPMYGWMLRDIGPSSSKAARFAWMRDHYYFPDIEGDDLQSPSYRFRVSLDDVL